MGYQHSQDLITPYHWTTSFIVDKKYKPSLLGYVHIYVLVGISFFYALVGISVNLVLTLNSDIQFRFEQKRLDMSL